MDRHELQKLVNRLRLRSDALDPVNSSAKAQLDEFTDSLENAIDDLTDMDQIDGLLEKIPELIEALETEDAATVTLLKRVRSALRGTRA